MGLKVTATYADGTSHDITRWATYDIREKPTAEVNRMGFVTAHRPGKTAVQVKYEFVGGVPSRTRQTRACAPDGSLGSANGTVRLFDIRRSRNPR